jgi:hypothetical protein
MGAIRGKYEWWGLFMVGVHSWCVVAINYNGARRCQGAGWWAFSMGVVVSNSIDVGVVYGRVHGMVVAIHVIAWMGSSIHDRVYMVVC